MKSCFEWWYVLIDEDWGRLMKTVEEIEDWVKTEWRFDVWDIDVDWRRLMKVDENWLKTDWWCDDIDEVLMKPWVKIWYVKWRFDNGRSEDYLNSWDDEWIWSWSWKNMKLKEELEVKWKELWMNDWRLKLMEDWSNDVKLEMNRIEMNKDWS